MPILVRTVRDALSSWFMRFGPLIAVFLLSQTLVRIGLALLSGTAFIDGPLDVLRPFFIGFWFDVAVLLAVLIPGTLYWVLLPRSWHGGRFDRAMTLSGFGLFAFIIGLVISNTLIVILTATGFIASQWKTQIYLGVGILTGIFSLWIGFVFLLQADAMLPNLENVLGALGS